MVHLMLRVCNPSRLTLDNRRYAVYTNAEVIEYDNNDSEMGQQSGSSPS